MNLTKKLILALLIPFTLVMGRDKEEFKSATLTFTANGKSYDLSTNAVIFQNYSDTYSITGTLNDTSTLLMVLPALYRKTYSENSSNRASLTFTESDMYSTSFSEDPNFKISITEFDPKNSIIKGEFSGRLDLFSAETGNGPDSLEITQGKFAMILVQ